MLAIICTHAGPHAAVELAMGCMHLGWYAKVCEYLSQQLSLGTVVRFLQVNETHLQGDVFSRPSF